MTPTVWHHNRIEAMVMYVFIALAVAAVAWIGLSARGGAAACAARCRDRGAGVQAYVPKHRFTDEKSVCDDAPAPR